MSELVDNLSKIMGRQISQAEANRLYRIRDTLGLKDNDALWLIVVALEYYQVQYESFPMLIANSARDILLSLKATADATTQASVQAAKSDLAKAVATAAQEVAHNTSVKQMWQWACGCFAVAFLCVGLFGWYVHSQALEAGYFSGYGVAYKEAKDERAAAAWANTPEGRVAYRLAQAGSLGKLANCDQPGWFAENGICYVKTTPNGVIYGWKLP